MAEIPSVTQEHLTRGALNSKKISSAASVGCRDLLAAACGIPLALLLSTFRNFCANRIIVHGTKAEFFSCPFTVYVDIKSVEHDLVAVSEDVALCVTASIFAAGANADDTDIRRLRRAVRWPTRETVFHDPVRKRRVL